jgi:flavorubredoxin
MAVLVACASKHRSTTEVAQRIAAALIENGVDAKVMRVDDVIRPKTNHSTRAQPLNELSQRVEAAVAISRAGQHS